MKKLLLGFVALSVISTHSYAVEIQMDQLVDKAEIQEKVRKELLKLDVKFSLDLGDIDIVDGINLSNRYRYEVEPSYQDKYFTRIDKWDIKANIDAGTLLKDVVDLPFSFNVSRNNSFIFVRQFQEKKKALNAIPYTPAKLPMNANKALKLKNGDFVAIPANLNIGFSAGVGTQDVAPVAVVNANASAFFVVSGEFTIQVFKIDDTHVRVKIISSRSLNGGANVSANSELNLAGFRVFASNNDGTENDSSGFGSKVSEQIDKQLKRQTVRLVDKIIDREFLNFGVNYTPGASYIADYIFDLSDEDAVMAYNQILSASYKLKDVIAVNNFLDARSLKDKLITTTAIADKLSELDASSVIEYKRVTRIFKGFNDFKGNSRHLKLGALVANFSTNTSYVENKLTFIDKKNQSMEFFYPTYTKYFETNFGKWIFNLKDQANKNYFGLIPRKNDENVDYKSPDIGLTFERKDKILTHLEQKSVTKFIINQLPTKIIQQINFNDWKNGDRKLDSRIYFQVILKSQGFNYLRVYSQEEIVTTLVEYLKKKKLLHIVNEDINNRVNTETKEVDQETPPAVTYEIDKIVGDFVEAGEIKFISSVIYHALHDDKNVSTTTLTKLIKLNENPLFRNVGIGYLISLLPEDKLNEYTYVKIELNAEKVDKVSQEFGTLNYKVLYNEINTLQSRLSNRSYDLRVSKEDIEMKDTEAEDGMEKEN